MDDLNQSTWQGGYNQVPIEFLHNGPLGMACGTPFQHLVEREWILTVNLPYLGTFTLPMFTLIGSFGWYFLGGNIKFNNKFHLVLFCNEPIENNSRGHCVYVSKTLIEAVQSTASESKSSSP